jgi:hypothetical protein
MANTIPLQGTNYYRYRKEAPTYDVDLEPYASLFLKPLTNKKCAFSKQDLEVMCRDPLHSPRLIVYLINFFKQM